jgi:hypothetical protein
MEKLGIQGIPISQIAQAMGISPNAVKMRLSHRGIKPFGYIGRVGLYTLEDLDKIKEDLPRGRNSPKYGKVSAAIKQIIEQVGSSTEPAAPQ